MTEILSSRSRGAWLREMLRLKPARWPWGHSIRAALSVGLPLAAGLAAGQVDIGLWISMGTLMCTAGEGTGSYRAELRRIAIAAPVGACGAFAGYLGGLPLPIVIAAMTGIAFFAGIVNGFGRAASIGTMQGLLMAAIVIGVPDLGPYWRVAALYLAGAAFYAFLLWLEALTDPRRPERALRGALLAALAELAESRATRSKAADFERARVRAVDAAVALQAGLSPAQAAAPRSASLIRAAEQAFADILSAPPGDPRLAAMAADLRDLSGKGIQITAGTPDCVARLADALASTEDGGAPATFPPRDPGITRETLGQALRLAFCMGLAYASHWIVTASHWFWIPLTVTLVMKPDLGSVFARALLRCLGTLMGAVLGAMVLLLLPKGYGLIFVLALFAGAIPWAMLRSYALQALVLTPLVLILLDIIAPGPHTIDYAGQRVIDTVIGGAIVVIFGYMLWPRAHPRARAAAFAEAMGLVAAYLRAAGAPEAAARGRAAYEALAVLRGRLIRALPELGAAGCEAAAWLPPIAAAERICDRITAAATSGALPLSDAEIETLARGIEAVSPQASPPAGVLATEIDWELARITRLRPT